MQPSHPQFVQVRRNHQSLSRSPTLEDQPATSPVPLIARRLRPEDSWVDISSQPSSSSLSSTGENDILPAAIQFRQSLDSHRRSRRRRSHPDTAAHAHRFSRPSHGGDSSQDEHDESESESDRMMSSSNEDAPAMRANSLGYGDENERHDGEVDDDDDDDVDDDDDDDDDATALGMRRSLSDDKPFTPQPNAFSHPPASQAAHLRMRSVPEPSSYFPPTSAISRTAGYASANPILGERTLHTSQRPSFSSEPSRPRGACHVVGPSGTYQPDHDAALRASLSTLLSCAAAVRGCPKHVDVGHGRDVASPEEPTSLRLVPGSELYGDLDAAPPSLPPRKTRVGSGSSSSTPAIKRKARESSKDRLSKKSRATKAGNSSSSSSSSSVADEAPIISPVLMNWMISAGFVLVFSAISFSVGYVWGKELSKVEGTAMNMAVGGGDGAGTACGREATAIRTGSGLRRLRWSSASTSLRA